MNRFKKNLAILIIYVLLVSSIIQFANANGIFIFNTSFFPVLTFCVVLTILVPIFTKWSLLPTASLWLAVYAAIWLVLVREFNQDKLIMLFVELVFVFIGVVSARETALSYKDLEYTLDKLIFASFSGRAMLIEEAEEEIKTELTRSRRYHRPLSLVLLEPDPGSAQNEFTDAPKEMQRHLARRYIMAQIAEIIDKEARRTDLVIKQNKPDRFIILCPETQSSNTNTLVRRIIDNVRDQTGIMVGFGVASFPDEALTFEELVNRADSKLVKPGAYLIPDAAVPVKLKQ